MKISNFMCEEVIVFKLLVVGAKGVGKSAFVQKSVDYKITNNSSKTIGVDFNLKSFKYTINGKYHDFAFQLWDMAEENRFKSIRQHYIAGTQGLILCFSTGDVNELNVLNNWIQDINKYTPTKVPMVLIRTKIDLTNRSLPIIKRELINEFMRSFDIDDYIEISSATGQNITKVYQVFAKLCYKNFLT